MPGSEGSHHETIRRQNLCFRPTGLAADYLRHVADFGIGLVGFVIVAAGSCRTPWRKDPNEGSPMSKKDTSVYAGCRGNLCFAALASIPFVMIAGAVLWLGRHFPGFIR